MKVRPGKSPLLSRHTTRSPEAGAFDHRILPPVEGDASFLICLFLV